MNELSKKFEGITAKECVEHFGAAEMLDVISDGDLANYISVCPEILYSVSDETLIDNISDDKTMLDSMDSNTIIEYLEKWDYVVTEGIDGEHDSVLNLIKGVCRRIQPKGYIGNEEAKKIICDYIDNWMTKSF